MANRLRKFVDSVLFAGLQPAQTHAETRRLRWLGPLSGPVDRFLSGGPAPSDPLYLTNRTLAQRLRPVVLVSIPVLVVAGLVSVALSNRFFAPKVKVAAEPTRAEIAAKLDHVLKNVSVETKDDVQVVEASVQFGSAHKVTGLIRNNTDRKVASAEVVFDLANAAGSQVGAVKTVIKDLAPKTTMPFEISIVQNDAVLAITRDIIVN